VLGAVLLAGAATWAVFVSSSKDLRKLSQEQYQEALQRVGARFAAFESLNFKALIRSQWRSQGPQGALAWGTLALQTPGGEEAYLWVSLQWSAILNSWKVKQCFLLADPRDRHFFAESLLAVGTWQKISSALSLLKRKFTRRWNEIWGGEKE
jgi:hypothetical protein